MLDKKKLDIGAGTRVHHPDCIAVDRLDLSKYHKKGKFVQCDVEKDKLPFDDDSVDEVWCSQVLEHMNDIIHPMEEIHRVCCNGAMVHIDVPHEHSKWKWGDPTHKRGFNELSFLFFCKGMIRHGTDYGINTDFDVKNMIIDPRTMFLYVDLECVKPIRWDLHKPETEFKPT